VGVPLQEFLFKTSHSRYTEIFGRSGELQYVGLGETPTFYLGQKGKSKDLFRIYGLPSEKLPTPAIIGTRFEHVDQGTRPLLSQLHLIGNPFEKLHVYLGQATKPAAWSTSQWRLFLSCATHQGLNSAVQQLQHSERKAGLKALTVVEQNGLKLAWKDWQQLIEK